MKWSVQWRMVNSVRPILRALHDRAIDYEKTSFRGLFRFLRFIDRMRKRGDDLGAARSLTEKENVVRIMTIHSSKGLEFPYRFHRRGRSEIQ